MQQRTAEQLFRVLGELKGGAMKLGQALSIFESALPEELAAPYRQQLTRAAGLRSADVGDHRAPRAGHRARHRLAPAAASSSTTTRRRPPRSARCTAAAGTTAARSRSRCSTPAPGDALLSDLRQISRVARTFGGLVPGIDIKPLVAELQARVAEELDYGLEAEAQHAFAVAFAGDPDFAGPRRGRALRQGAGLGVAGRPRSLSRVIAEGTQDERDHYGELYARFLFDGPARAGLLHADPHPGNFRICPPDGSLGGIGVARLRRRRPAAGAEPARTHRLR